MQHLKLATTNSRAGVDLIPEKPWNTCSYPREGVNYDALGSLELTEKLQTFEMWSCVWALVGGCS